MTNGGKRGGGAQADRLKKATADYLDTTWHRLARDYLRKENFDPDPTDKGVKGILLAEQLRLPERLPLLRDIAATERFKHWSAPRWKADGFNNVRELARAAITEIEREVTPDTVVTTLAGITRDPGSGGGTGSESRFFQLSGVTAGSASSAFVADSINTRITEGTPVIAPPRFGGLSLSSGALAATLSGLPAGATVVLESSSNLRDWAPVQTNIANSTSLSVSGPINPAGGTEFLRALLR
jgi:hypothetical protein